eukprot:2760599-Lingulodinium_polyedra.AAC.1
MGGARGRLPPQERGVVRVLGQRHVVEHLDAVVDAHRVGTVAHHPVRLRGGVLDHQRLGRDREALA